MLQVHQDRSGGLAAPVAGTLFEGRVARIHPDDDPLRYSWGNESRDAAGLQEILDQLQTPHPFTLLHPDDLISRGAKANVIGTVIQAWMDDDHVVTKILVTDPKGLAAIQDGVHELSLGYTSQLDEHGRQRQIVVDHLALVPTARCGSSCALRADCGKCTCNNHAKRYTTRTVEDQPAQDAVLSTKTRHELPSTMFADPAAQALPIEDETHVRAAMARFNQTNFKGPSERKAAYYHIIARAHQLGVDPADFQKKFATMDEGNETTMDELTKKLTEALTDAATQRARADAAEAQLKVATDNLTKVEVDATNSKAALNVEKTRADAAEQAAQTAIEKSRLDTASSLGQIVKDRVALETKATEILGAADRSTLSDRDIKVAVIAHVDGMNVPVDKVPAWVDGVYEGSLTRAKIAAISIATVRAAIAAPVTRTDGVLVQPGRLVPTGPEAERAARAEMVSNKYSQKG